MSITIDQCLEMSKLIPLMSPISIFAILGAASTATLAGLSFIKGRTGVITLRIAGITLLSLQGLSLWLWIQQNPDWLNLLTTVLSYLE